MSPCTLQESLDHAGLINYRETLIVAIQNNRLLFVRSSLSIGRAQQTTFIELHRHEN